MQLLTSVLQERSGKTVVVGQLDVSVAKIRVTVFTSDHCPWSIMKTLVQNCHLRGVMSGSLLTQFLDNLATLLAWIAYHWQDPCTSMYSSTHAHWSLDSATDFLFPLEEPNLCKCSRFWEMIASSHGPAARRCRAELVKLWCLTGPLWNWRSRYIRGTTRHLPLSGSQADRRGQAAVTKMGTAAKGGGRRESKAGGRETGSAVATVARPKGASILSRWPVLGSLGPVSETTIKSSTWTIVQRSYASIPNAKQGSSKMGHSKAQHWVYIRKSRFWEFMLLDQWWVCGVKSHLFYEANTWKTSPVKSSWYIAAMESKSLQKGNGKKMEKKKKKGEGSLTIVRAHFVQSWGLLLL